jgi:hypothetical protein
VKRLYVETIGSKGKREGGNMREQIAAQLERVGDYVQELPEEGRGLPCFVHHEDAGGRCEREATMMVYGLQFCEIHGAEIKAGALEELFQDAADMLERPDNPHVPALNPAAALALRSGRDLLIGATAEAGEAGEVAMRRAYAEVPERVREMAVRFCRDEQEYGPEYAVDRLRDVRLLLHKLMRLACDKGEDWLVEQLELERESTTAQIAVGAEYAERLRKRRRQPA